MGGRSKAEIVLAILEECSKGWTKPQRIITHCNINATTQKPILKFLVNNGYLIRTGTEPKISPSRRKDMKYNRVVYCISEKGAKLRREAWSLIVLCHELQDRQRSLKINQNIMRVPPARKTNADSNIS
jgi:predicted transcriptional regulator